MINEFLQSLNASGKRSFEGLVGELLSQLTGVHFYAARSGDQGGRDGRAVITSGGEIAYECKRYSNETTLRDRELLGELAQAQQRRPELDVWILAASREVTDQNREPLENYGKDHGIDVVPLESVPSGTGTLDFLVAAYPQIVEKFADLNQLTKLAAALRTAANDVTARPKLNQLRQKFLKPDAGWPSWRESSHKEWNRVVSQKAATHFRFGQPLDVLSGNSIPRASAEAALNEWWANDPNRIFAMTGEEGDGKSWSVAQWITNKIQQSPHEFPPAVFVPSRDSGSAGSLEELLLDNVKRLMPNGNWKSKIDRWLEHREDNGKEPVALIVLDGLNERQTHDYWRKIIESTFDKPWAGKVRLICTVRNRYWNDHFAKLSSVPAAPFRLEPFSDAELRLVLKRHDLRLSDFPAELQSVLRKPRYFDLATKYRERVAESGDFTLARLYFEDWRDRVERSHREISESDFNDFLKRIAEKHRAGVDQLASSDIQSFIGFDADSRIAFRELATGGVLEKKGTEWKVSESRLPMGLGLLLSDDLASAAAGADLKEVINKWLEPHAGADMSGLIVEFAVLASVSQGAPPATVTALLQAWIDTQNPRSPKGDPVERRLAAYVPQCLGAYVTLSKSVWSGATENLWAQEVLIRGFSYWVRNSRQVVQGLIPVLEEWLAMVPIDGPAMLRRVAKMGAATESNTRVAELWPNAKANCDYDFDGYSLRVIDDDGWLRLSHAAFVIISFIEDRRAFVPAFVRHTIAKSIHDSFDGQEELRWAIRSSKIDLSQTFGLHIQRLLSDKRKIAQRTCSQLLRKIGSEAAWQALSAIDEDALYPNSEWHEEARKNPVESIFTCTIEDLEEYVTREEFKPWSFIDSVKPFITDPDVELPPETRKRLEPLIDQLCAQPVWQGQWASGEDHFLERAEIALARIDPAAIAKIIRRIVQSAPTRKVEALYSLCHRLEEYDLLLDTETRQLLEDARRNNPAVEGPADKMGMHCEFFLFSRTLPLWTGVGQLKRLIARPADANDWIDFENSYCGPVEGLLPDALTPRDWFRTLYYLSVLGEDKLSDDALENAFSITDSLTRGSLYRYCLSTNISNERFAPFIRDWVWSPNMHFMEQTFGSLLLIKLLEDDPSSESWKRVDPTFRATAILKSGGSEKDWAEYAVWFGETIAALQVPFSEDAVPPFDITHCVAENGRPGRISLAPQSDTSVKFVAPESHWGGRQPDEHPLAAMTERTEVIRERTKAQYARLRELNDKAAHKGNYWSQRCFPTDAIKAMLIHAPQVINASLRPLDEEPAPHVPPTGLSYYSALAEVFFTETGRIDQALALNQMLRSANYGVRIVDADTKLKNLDFDSYAAPATTETQSFWEEDLAAATSDLDLLELAIKVRHTPDADSSTWLVDRIERHLQNGTAFEQARAATLRGFLPHDPQTPWLLEATVDDDSWFRSVLRIAQRRAKAERDARFWFRRFCRETDLDQAWAAFRLMMTIVDRRVWLWVFDELKVLNENDTRRRFFESNRDEIRKACKKNEEKLPKTFVGCEVVDAMYPWTN